MSKAKVFLVCFCDFQIIFWFCGVSFCFGQIGGLFFGALESSGSLNKRPGSNGRRRPPPPPQEEEEDEDENKNHHQTVSIIQPPERQHLVLVFSG